MSKGERLRQLREKIGLSQTEAAEKIGVSKQTLYKYEKDIITNIPSDVVEKIAELYDVSPASIMGWVNIEIDVNDLSFDPTAYRKDFLERAVSYYHKIQELPPEYQTELENYLEYLQTRSDSHQTK